MYIISIFSPFPDGDLSDDREEWLREWFMERMRDRLRDRESEGLLNHGRPPVVKFKFYNNVISRESIRLCVYNLSPVLDLVCMFKIMTAVP